MATPSSSAAAAAARRLCARTTTAVPRTMSIPATAQAQAASRSYRYHHHLCSSQLAPSVMTTTPPHHQNTRTFHTTPPDPRRPRQPLAHNAEPVPEQPPPTDFGRMDVLSDVAVPATAVDKCLPDGFVLHGQQGGGRNGEDDEGVRVTIAGGDGALLVAGEAFRWRPWLVNNSSHNETGNGGGDAGTTTRTGKTGRRQLVNSRGQVEINPQAFGVLSLVWPRPDLLILGLGAEIRPLSPATRRAISDLGIRVEVLDTRNAASQYNMLATERGVEDVAAALIPMGWNDGE